MVFLTSKPPKPIILKEKVLRTENFKYKHLFKCFCGSSFIAIGADVNSGRTKSCGCWSEFVSKIQHIKHQLNKTTEHCAWVEMKKRCYNNNYKGYKNYGGRGIIVCDRWLESFTNFLFDMGNKPHSDLSLDRIDNDGNYEPNNCRWADRTIQSRNQRRHKNKVWSNA